MKCVYEWTGVDATWEAVLDLIKTLGDVETAEDTRFSITNVWFNFQLEEYMHQVRIDNSDDCTVQWYELVA